MLKSSASWHLLTTLRERERFVSLNVFYLSCDLYDRLIHNSILSVDSNVRLFSLHIEAYDPFLYSIVL